MYSTSVVDNALVGCFLAFLRNDFNTNKEHAPRGGSPVVCISNPIGIAKTSQDHIIAFQA